jgi:hypothetical protein
MCKFSAVGDAVCACVAHNFGSKNPCYGALCGYLSIPIYLPAYIYNRATFVQSLRRNMAKCGLLEYGIAVVLYIFALAEQIGISFFADDVERVCCRNGTHGGGINGSIPVAPNTTEVGSYCEERRNLNFQQNTLASTNVFFLVNVFTLVILQLQPLPRKPRGKVFMACLSWFVHVFSFFGHQGVIVFFALLTMFTRALAMGMSVALLQDLCINDTPIFDVYIRYIGLGFFNSACMIIFLQALQSRAFAMKEDVDITANIHRLGRGRKTTAMPPAIVQMFENGEGSEEVEVDALAGGIDRAPLVLPTIPKKRGG